MKPILIFLMVVLLAGCSREFGEGDRITNRRTGERATVSYWNHHDDPDSVMVRVGYYGTKKWAKSDIKETWFDLNSGAISQVKFGYAFLALTNPICLGVILLVLIGLFLSGVKFIGWLGARGSRKFPAGSVKGPEDYLDVLQDSGGGHGDKA